MPVNPVFISVRWDDNRGRDVADCGKTLELLEIEQFWKFGVILWVDISKFLAKKLLEMIVSCFIVLHNVTLAFPSIRIRKC